MSNRPKIAIIDPNTLSVLGLKSILQTVMPIMTVDTFGSFTELEVNHPEQYFHYFVSMNSLSWGIASMLFGSVRCFILSVFNVYDRKPSSAPAATAEPITPATLGPMACMSRKL